MAFQLSPGVLVVEKDLTSIVPAVSSSVGAFAGVFAWGPVLDPTQITSENQLVSRFGKFVGIRQRDVDTAFRWFDKYGTFVIFFGRLIPLIRSLVSIPAGLAKMNMVRFSLLTAAGSGIWNALWIYIGIQFGDRWRDAENWAKYLDYAVYALVVLITIVFVTRMIRRRGASAN